MAKRANSARPGKEDAMKRFPMIVAVAGLCLAAAACQSPQQKIASKTAQTLPMYNWDWGPWTGWPYGWYYY